MANPFDIFDQTAQQPAQPAQQANPFDAFGSSPQRKRTWQDVDKEALSNVVPSSKQAVKDFVYPFRHPIEAATGLRDVARGALQHGGIIAGNPDGSPTPEMQAASGVKQHYAGRYYGMDNIKKTLAEDPMGAFMDATVLAAPLRALAGPSKAARIAKSVDSVDKLKSNARKFFKASENKKATFTGKEYSDFVDNLGVDVVEEGAELHPKVVWAMKKLDEKNMGRDLTPKELMFLRRQVKKVAKSIDPDEKRIGQIMKHRIDEFIGAKVPELKTANDLWSRAMSGERMNKMIAKGEKKGRSWWTGAGSENAIRRQFDTFSDNERKMSMERPDVQAAIKHVAEGDRRTNVARNVGKLAPTSAIPMIATTGMTGTLAALGVPPVLAAGIGGTAAGVGMVGRKIATKRTRQAAAKAAATARLPKGKKLPSIARSPGPYAFPLAYQAGLLGREEP